jgi:hypothetical protein
VLRMLVIMLDLAVVSYAGAHCSDLLSNYSCSSMGALTLTDDEIVLLEPFKDCTEELKSTMVRFQRCKLQCLDGFFHGRGVWVFCPPKCKPAQPLYLSATIECLGDIWGPLWKLKDSNNPGKYSTYVVGSGSIVQWEYNPSTCPNLAEERFCHWISNEELEHGSTSTDNFGPEANSAYISFDGTEKLLIGAPGSSSATTSLVSPKCWTVNFNCSMTISKARTLLRENGRICIVGASKPYHYNDSNQYQLQIGYSGVNASATRQYKRVEGQSLKEILIELWAMEPEMRDPQLLEDLHGVGVSMCTYNAQRVSLAQILRLKCMRHLLRDFDWQDPSYSVEYFLNLEDPLRPQRLLDAKYKERFDRAVMLGLKMLSKTGIDRENNLRVFLSSACTPKPELVTIGSKEHSWTGLLKDTITECTMAVFADTCLELKYQSGISCGQTGRSAFRSAMVPNLSLLASIQANPPSSSLKWYLDPGYGVPTPDTGRLFSLGDRGALYLKCNLGSDGLVVGWTSNRRLPSGFAFIRERFLNQGQLHNSHREYTEIDHSEDGRNVQLVPIFVISDQKSSQGLYSK